MPRALALTPEEAEHLAALVNFDQAETEEERDRAWTRVRAARHFRDAPRIEGDSLAYLAHWRPSAIRELATFQQRMLDLCDSATDARTRVVQVNRQLVPLSERVAVEPIAAANAATSNAHHPNSSR